MKICYFFIFSHFISFPVSHECKVLGNLDIILLKKNIFFFFSIKGTFQLEILLLKIRVIYSKFEFFNSMHIFSFNLILHGLSILNS